MGLDKMLVEMRDSRSKNRRMLMHAQRPHRIARGRNLPHGFVLPNVPQLDLAVPRSADQLPEPTALHVHVGDPLLVLAPAADHGKGGLLAGVEDANGAVAVAGAEDVAGDLVRGQGCDAGAGARGDVLVLVVSIFGFREVTKIGGPYIGADFSRGVPHPDDLDVSCHE